MSLQQKSRKNTIQIDRKFLIIRRSGSGNTNALLNLVGHQTTIDKIYLHTKGPYERKHQLFINKRKKVSLKHWNDSKAFIEYSNDMGIYDNIDK